jgi:branched-chain amino acid transport system ATP-binding protein
MSLEINDLTAGYGQLRVLEKLSCTVPTGSILAVVGANGAGKTTLLRAVDGLIPATSGSVTLDGEQILGLPTEKLARRGLAHVPENRLVFPGLSVKDNLVLGAWSKPRDAPFDETLALFPRLVPRLAQAAGSLSGGEQQMLAIGRALMSRPKALLLDEPSIGLAPKAVVEIMDVLGRLRDSGDMSILLVEQNLSAAFRVADRAIVVAHGRVALEGSPDELMHAPEVREAYFGGLDAKAS